MLNVTIDSKHYSFETGLTIAQALKQLTIVLPSLCDDPRLAPIGACRLCLVEVDGQMHPVASCSTVMQEGMKIRTHSVMLQKLRQTNLSLLTEHYPAAAISAEPQHAFHHVLRAYSIKGSETSTLECFHDESHPLIGMDMSRCIACQRCVRICDEVQGQNVWQVWGRGAATHIATADHHSMLSSGCVSCGACVDTCPTGALFDRAQNAQALSMPTKVNSERAQDKSQQDTTLSATQWTRSTCVYCGVGCQLDVGTHTGKVVEIRPADGAVNKGHLCVKGRYAFAFNHATDRVTEPMRRENGIWKIIGWDDALDFVADRLQQIMAKHGAQACGVLGSARATNEDNFLAQKFARLVLGTHNVDCCARVCHAPSAAALKTMLGTGAATNSFDDIEHAELFLIVGCNPTDNHPVVGARIKQALRRGARLIVIDPRRIELADDATLHLQLIPGTNVALLNAMAACVLEEQLHDHDYLAQRVDGLAALIAHLTDYTPEKMADQCGVRAEDIRHAARLYARTSRAMSFHGLGLTEHGQGTDGVMALINLALLCGHIGKLGAGVNPLRGQNNVQGSAQMGCEPASLTGSQSIAAAGARFEKLWGKPLPTSNGMTLMQMMDAARDGRFKALLAMGYDIHSTLAHQERTAESLRALDLLVVQDLFLTETAREFAHVFFPVASVFERDGTFMNSDRRVQRVRATLPPPGNAKPDAWIVMQLAARMGYANAFSYNNSEAIWNEIRSLWPAGAGLSYPRIEQHSLQWPCPDETHPGTPVLHRERFTIGERASLRCINFTKSSEQCDAQFPLLLNTGRHLVHFNAGTMSYRSATRHLRPSDTLDLHPFDAQALNLRERDIVRVSSRYGSTCLPLHIDDRVQRGEAFCSFHLPALHVNRLTSDVRDTVTGAPEYKRTAVRVQKAEQADGYLRI